MRIAKFIAHTGYCSRRNAEKLIINKKVYVNHNLCISPSVNVFENDKVSIDKKILKLNKKIRLWKLYKPTHVLCTNYDPKKRKKIFDLIPKNIPRIISVGRLDFMSEGLILLTNNGDFARKLELPKSNIQRTYKVYISSNISIENIKKINNGLKINKILYKKIKVELEKKEKNKTWLRFNLLEGKNREIRNICKHFKWPIIKLIRIEYGSIKLKNEKPGQIVEIIPIPKDLL